MYNLQGNLKTMSDGFFAPQLFARDDGSVDRQKLLEYFENAFKIFNAKLESFKQADSLTAENENELRFMLEALLAAKHLLTEEDF